MIEIVQWNAKEVAAINTLAIMIRKYSELSECKKIFFIK